MKILVNILVSSLAVIVTAKLLPGVTVDNFGAAIAVAAFLGIVSALLAPTLQFLRLSVNLPTLGLVTFVITGLLVMLAAEAVRGFHVAGFRWALAFALVLSAINAFFHRSSALRLTP